MTIFELINSRIAVPVTDQASAAYLTALAVVEQEVKAGAWTTVDLGASYGISSDAAICKRSGNTITAVLPRSAFIAIESDFMFTTIPGCTQSASASGSSASWYAGASHPGIATLKCSALANSGYQYLTGGNSIIIGGGEKVTLVFQHLLVRATAFARYGLQNSSAIQTAPATGIYFDIAGTGTAITLTGRCRNSSAETATATSCTLTAGTWYTGTIEVSSGITRAIFTLYSEAGAQIWQEIVTTNLPGSTTQTGFQIAAGDTSTAGATDIAYLDYVRLEINRTLAR